jgi:hypothetical protein
MSRNVRSPEASRPLFGREPDMSYLLARARTQGLTAVIGRPQIGKSRLLRQACTDLRLHHGFLTGYAESTGETADLLLRALSDLYTSWIQDASYRQQLKLLYTQHKGNLVGGVGSMVAQVADKVLALSQVTPPIVGDIVKQGMLSLLDFEREFKSGGMTLPKLSYEQARDLVGIVANLVEKPICLVLDAWDQSPAVDREAALITSYLDHLSDWPAGCHIFLGVREGLDNEVAARCVREFSSRSAAVALYPLGKMHLQDRVEQARMLLYLRQRVSPAQELKDELVLELLDGYPGVLQRWLQGRPTTKEELIALAGDAQNYQYREFENLCAKLLSESQHRTLAIRVALFPEITSDEAWQTYRPVILEDWPEELILDLQRDGIFDDSDHFFPSYGHIQRHEAARVWFTTKRKTNNARPYARHETEHLILCLVEKSPGFSPAAWPFVQALAGFLVPAKELELGDLLSVVCLAARSMSAGPLVPGDQEMLLQSAKAAAKAYPAARWLLEAGLLNIAHAEGTAGMGRVAEELLAIKTTSNPEKVLDRLYATQVSGPVVDKSFTADTAEEDRVIQKLWEHLEQHPEDEEARVWLAKALHEAFMDALGRDDRTRTRKLKGKARDFIAGIGNTLEVCKILEMITETDMGL